jgi:hypothetical protein
MAEAEIAEAVVEAAEGIVGAVLAEAVVRAAEAIVVLVAAVEIARLDVTQQPTQFSFSHLTNHERAC